MAIERDTSSIDTIIIHCAATPNGSGHTAEDIDHWHSERGFYRHSGIKQFHAPRLQHIGYHFVIRANGITEMGRSIKEIGAHARGHNTRSIGICLIGTDHFTADQWNSLRALVTDLRRENSRIRQVIGHRAVDRRKICPGFSVSDWLAAEMGALPQHLYPQSEDSNGQSA